MRKLLIGAFQMEMDAVFPVRSHISVLPDLVVPASLLRCYSYLSSNMSFDLWDLEPSVESGGTASWLSQLFEDFSCRGSKLENEVARPVQWRGAQCFEEEDKTENGGTPFGHKHHLESVFSSSLYQLIILHSTYHRLMLAQLIPWEKSAQLANMMKE